MCSPPPSRIDPEIRESERRFGEMLQWSRLFVAAVAVRLPLHPADTDESSTVLDFAEGAAITQPSTRYARDRRNCAVAIAVWGCKLPSLRAGLR